MGSNKNFHSLLMGMQNVTAAFDVSLAVYYKIEHTLIIWSSNYFPRYLFKCKTYVYNKSCTPMYIAVLFITAPTRSNQDAIQ